MEIRVVPEPPVPLRQITPEELCEGRQTVTVVLERPITLEIENCVVTYTRGEHQAPCVIANVLFEQGAERVGPDGLFVKRAGPKPAPMRYPSPFSGIKRWELR
jgi:hypothetical protein